MRIAVTGTPGTGKTTAVDLVQTPLSIVHLNDVIKDRCLYTEIDEIRDSVVADLDAIRAWFDDRNDVLVESHLAHHLPVDRVIVLRCRPDVLEPRLRERADAESAPRTDRATNSTSSARSVHENAESEALDLILVEAVEIHGLNAIYEIDTTDRKPNEVSGAIEQVIAGSRPPSAGTVTFEAYL